MTNKNKGVIVSVVKDTGGNEMDALKLKYVIQSHGYSVEEISKKLGISRTAFYRKCNGKSEFVQSEIQKLIELLEIDNPVEIFFAHKVS